MMHEQHMVPFTEAAFHRKERLRNTAASGKKIIGYFCTYTPIELIHASGFLPVRIWGEQVRVEQAYTLVPNFICPYMRQSLERAMAGEYDFLSGLVQGYTCDIACGLFNVWKENIPLELFHSLPLPYNDTEDSRLFFREGVQELLDKLSGIGGCFSEDSLEETLMIYGQIREHLLALDVMRSTRRFAFGAEAFAAMLRAGFFLDPLEFLGMLADLKGALEGKEKSPAEGIPVILSGSLIEDSPVLALIEELGGVIVSDDLCDGMRNASPAYGTGATPTERLLDRYMRRLPCPARARPSSRASLLLDQVRTSRARGVFFVFQKFCSPHLADYPSVSETLKKEGIPSILIELDEEGVMDGQIRTRLETFFSVLEG
ncbi:MAG: 2-hydroxyacyl-CoA dehydratase family protein [Desulfomonilia bacterium]|nr:2-hydroxyacyl-CoA dehydratase family protein [Desulfomonilia bacterium]